MSKTKRRKSVPPHKIADKGQKSSAKIVSQKGKKPNKVAKEGYSIKDYLLINLIFWGFCIALYFIVWIITGENTGLSFLFGVLGIGFTLMSVFDYLYDYFSKKNKTKASNLQKI